MLNILWVELMGMFFAVDGEVVRWTRDGWPVLMLGGRACGHEKARLLALEMPHFRS